ncbi:hypothetical protein GCM10029964_073570 [Kibdelosporangium lantanae]
MPYRLGIDLGTTFTAAAIYRDHTVQSELVPLGTHSASVPTVLFVDGATTLVGEPADRRALTHPSCVVRDVKRRLGDPTPLLVGGQPHSAPELVARLVDWVVTQVTAREGAPPSGIAVTYPAAWGPHRESLLRNALPDVSLLTEPQAAALAYASTERVEVGATIAVYDLGGGTFDAVVVRKTATGFTLLGTPPASTVSAASTSTTYCSTTSSPTPRHPRTRWRWPGCGGSAWRRRKRCPWTPRP